LSRDKSTVACMQCKKNPGKVTYSGMTNEKLGEIANGSHVSMGGGGGEGSLRTDSSKESLRFWV